MKAAIAFETSVWQPRLGDLTAMLSQAFSFVSPFTGRKEGWLWVNSLPMLEKQLKKKKNQNQQMNQNELLAKL